ncbi:MAG TPA: lipocalin-like domain-containing protein [Sphingomonas sp.]|nr:lipocalin-like domain-containing protein [Sphingomonas sp.]
MFKLLPPPRTIEVAAAALLIGGSLAATSAATERPSLPRELVGTWSLVAADVQHPDGSIGHDYGAAPRGRMMVDAAGRYTVMIYNSERPRFASGGRATGTPQEYRETALGMSVHYGMLSADVKAHTLTFAIEQASFANWNGTRQVRQYELKGRVLRYTVAARPNGDIPISTWRKVA